MNYAGKFAMGELNPFSGGDIGLGPLQSPHGHLSSPGEFHVDKVSTQAPADAIIIPDAHLLFNGDFKRSGVDLILTNSDRELVLPEYFKGEKRAALANEAQIDHPVAGANPRMVAAIESWGSDPGTSMG